MITWYGLVILALAQLGFVLGISLYITYVYIRYSRRRATRLHIYMVATSYIIFLSLGIIDLLKINLPFWIRLHATGIGSALGDYALLKVMKGIRKRE